jgi:hypothetical protein
MGMRAGLVMICGAFLLAGCATTAPSDTAGQAARAARDDALCRSYGAYPGTTPYVQCRLGLRQQEAQSHQNESPLQRLFD